LNLLPENLQVSKNLNGFFKAAKALNVIFILSFAIFGVIIGGLFVMNRLSLNNIQKEIDTLKTQVRVQETSEQQLVLLKDRLMKIASIKSNATASKNIVNVDSLFTNVSPLSQLNQADISSSKMGLSLIIKSNEDLVSFLDNIKNSNLFTSADLSTLSYSANSGYTVEAVLFTK